MENRIDVLVVGAGPVGLFCANELIRHGLSCRIIDKKDFLSDKSKALGLHIRTLDVFNDCGLIDQVLDQGHKVKVVIIKSNGRRLVNANFAGIDANHHFMIDLPQDKTERILYEHLTQSGLNIEWNTALNEVKQTSEHVIATLTRPDGNEEQVHSTWLIACDGSHSTVRHRCNVNFEGEKYQQNWWLADLKIDWALPDDHMNIYINKHGPLACFPMGDKRYRLVMTAPSNDDRDPELADIQAAFIKRSDDSAILSSPIWLTKFDIHHRQIPTYRINRIFFAGDAAHIHSPMGGQGLNTGIQDIYNLIWKLALVHKGRANGSLLDSYHQERYAVGKQVLEDTDRMTRMILIKNPWVIKIRNTLISFVMSFKRIQNNMASRIAELKISYANSRIVEERAHNKHVKAGHFLTDFMLTSYTNKATQTLSQIVQGTKFHLFLFTGQSGITPSILDEIAALIDKNYSTDIKLHLVSQQIIEFYQGSAYTLWLDEQAIQRTYEVQNPMMVLLRPDKYIGFTQSPIDVSEFSRYLRQLFNNDGH